MTEIFLALPLSSEFSEQIAHIEKACFKTPWTVTSVKESFDCGTLFFGVICDGALIGYCGLNAVCGEGYITNIAVLPQWRKKGVGIALMNALCDYAAQNRFEFLTLEVRTSNIPAIRLYEKFGFENAGTRKNFYRLPTEDAYIFTKQMNSGEQL